MHVIIEQQLEILIIIHYYERPKMLKQALDSIVTASKQHDKIQIHIYDNNSKSPASDVVQTFSTLKSITKCFSYDHDVQQTPLCAEMNSLLIEGSHDLIITLTDDDMIHPNYLKNLSDFMIKNRDVTYCYSDIVLYSTKPTKVSGSFNLWSQPIYCPRLVDGAQVAFRKECFGQDKINLFLVDDTIFDIDLQFFERAASKIGMAKYTGFISQYKRIHKNQLNEFRHLYRILV